MSRSVSVGLAFVMVLGLSGSLLAQRDPGAKARGEFGTGFWNSQRVDRGAYYYRPAQPSLSYRAYSYEPLGVHPGDAVIVANEGTKLMSGRHEVAQVEQGQSFTISRIINGWLGAQIERDGKTLKGWIWHKNVDLATDVPAPPASLNQ